MARKLENEGDGYTAMEYYDKCLRFVDARDRKLDLQESLPEVTATAEPTVEPTAEPTVSGRSIESMPICLASEPDTIDPALNSAVDGATMIAHLFSGLATWAQKDDGTLEIVADCATELPEGVTNSLGHGISEDVCRSEELV